MAALLAAWFGCRGAGAPDLAFEVGGVDGPAPVVVAIHGLGDVPESLVALVEACRLPVRVVAPRGPTAHHGGWSWYDVGLGPGGAVRDEAQIRASADRVGALIVALSRRDDTVGRPVVTGFSQGGVLAFAVAALHPDVVGLAVPIAGALPASLVAAGRSGPGGPRIRALHGEADAVVPVAEAQATVDGLRAAGRDVELVRFPGVRHEVTAEVHREVCAALASALP